VCPIKNPILFITVTGSKSQPYYLIINSDDPVSINLIKFNGNGLVEIIGKNTICGGSYRGDFRNISFG
jgi:hypothetical protein